MSSRHSVLPIERRLVEHVLIRTGRIPVQIVLWNGESISVTGDEPVARVFVADRRMLWRLACHPEVSFGEGYSEGRIRVEGDLIALLESIYRRASEVSDSVVARAFSRWLERQQRNSPGGSRRNIHHHYDIRTDFYKLWLDAQLVYTCAYFPTPEGGLEEAQVAKMHHVCRKLGLQSGETVIEAGCGWGALALHMAEHYGVSVKAFNISHEQIVYARECARARGLERRVEFIEDDYRNVQGGFDAFVSVGMLEHVGLEHYSELGKVINRVLGDAGRGFLHFIGRDRERPLSAWIRHRIFPGAYPPTLRQALDILEPWGFAVLDVENLRLHYARTLEHWLDRFEASARKVSEMFTPEFVRAWRLYLAGSMVAFRTGSMQLFQIAFARRASNRIPWTRARLYAGEGEAEGTRSWIPAMS